MNELSDEELMSQYQNGSGNAFQILYERHSSKVYNYLKKRLAREEKVAEIYQNVFLKVHRSKHLYDGALPLLPWLFTVTRTVMLDELKKDKNFKYDPYYNLENIPADANLDRPRTNEITQLIQDLPEMQKKAIQLRYFNDQSFEEIAESLKITPLNARQIISRGLKRLKSLISERSST